MAHDYTDAETLREIADHAIRSMQKQDRDTVFQVIDHCRTAAQKGAYYVVWEDEVNDNVKNELEKRGLKVKRMNPYGDSPYTELSWERK